MAIFSLSVKSLNRKAGRSAVAAAAYRSCSKLTDERDGETYDFRKKQSLATPADSFIIAPNGAEWAQDRSALWNAAEAAENRGNSTTAREWLAALPAELDADEQRALVQQFAQELTQRFGVAADVSIHEPSKDGDQRNRHAHILTTTRTVDADGLGKKTRELDVKTTASAAVEEMRQRWAELANAALEKAGSKERIDNRSYERQGVDKEPEMHLGAKATKAKRAGLQHPRLERAEIKKAAGRVRQTRKRAKRHALQTTTADHTTAQQRPRINRAQRVRKARERAEKAAQQRASQQIGITATLARKIRLKRLQETAARHIGPIPETPHIFTPAQAIERRLKELGADHAHDDLFARQLFVALTKRAKRPLAGIKQNEVGAIILDCAKAAGDLVNRSHTAILWLFEQLEAAQKKRAQKTRKQQQAHRSQRRRDGMEM